MDRRDFLAAPAKKASAAPAPQPASGRRITSGLAPYTGAWGTNEMIHLLKRTMFGASISDINYFRGRTLTQAVDELLNPASPLPSPPVNEYNSAGFTDPVVAAGQTWVNNQTNDGTANSLRRASFKKWWTGTLINQDRSIREKMTLFWANHFGTETRDIGNAQYMYKHHNLLRSMALGNFKDMVRQVTFDPGMLIYLNGYLNTASAPDENYGRELLELFTLGKGPGSQYTEDDVKKAARVLTGWQVNGTTMMGFFNSNRHDSTNKQFSSFFNNTTITGRTGAAAGLTELNDLLDMIFAKDEVSKHLVRKLYRWFVYYEIDASTEANVIEPLAQVFRNNNYNVKPVLDLLLKSEHFFDVLNQGCQIKSPIDFVIASCREFNMVFPNSVTDYVNAYNMWNFIYANAVTMNQDIGDPPNVSGWPAYYQEPQFYEYWINSDTLPKRNQYTDLMVNNGYTRNGRTIKIDVVEFAKLLPNAADPNALIDDSLAILFRLSLTTASKQSIKKQILLSNQDQDYYWSNAWNAYIVSPTGPGNFTTVNTRLKDLFRYFLSLAEYQLA
jgi:uncharacterized protein (DUF1800 family)